MGRDLVESGAPLMQRIPPVRMDLLNPRMNKETFVA